MDIVKNHNFWKEFVDRGDKLNTKRDRSKARKREEQRRQRFAAASRNDKATRSRSPLRIGGGCPTKPNGSEEDYQRISPEHKVCVNCREQNWDIPVPYGEDICPRCHGRATFHIIRCCPCGFQPSPLPRPIYLSSASRHSLVSSVEDDDDDDPGFDRYVAFKDRLNRK